MPISLTKQGQLSATFDGSAGVLMPGLDAYRSVSVPGVLYIPSDTKDGQAAEAMISAAYRAGVSAGAASTSGVTQAAVNETVAKINTLLGQLIGTVAT
jgi:hypothetical protein